eukprot:m.335872 g.335872  ORF g.335872 m.335872 type:complete len:606 (-) comp19795_c0_seq11:3901-5718(-)
MAELGGDHAGARAGGTMQDIFYRDTDAVNVLSADLLAAPRVSVKGKVLQPNALNSDGPKLCSMVSTAPSLEELAFLSQMGVTHCYAWYATDDGMTLETVAALRDQVQQAGMQLYNVGVLSLAKSPNTILNLDGREDVLSRFARFIKLLASAGITHTTFTWEAEGKVYSTGKALVRGGAVGRFVDGRVLAELPLAFDREYTEDELWTNMKYFLDYLVPVAEKAGVRLLLHPNDPPMAEKIAGVPCLLRSPEAFERVFELAKGSEAVGMEFCCGTWMEGLKLEADQDGDGAQGGTSCIGCFGVGQAALLKSLQWFVQQGRVSVVHLRNTSRSLPAFAETFVDDGFVDIAAIAKVLHEAKYTGTVVLDHTPPLAGCGRERVGLIGSTSHEIALVSKQMFQPSLHSSLPASLVSSVPPMTGPLARQQPPLLASDTSRHVCEVRKRCAKTSKPEQNNDLVCNVFNDLSAHAVPKMGVLNACFCAACCCVHAHFCVVPGKIFCLSFFPQLPCLDRQRTTHASYQAPRLPPTHIVLIAVLPTEQPSRFFSPSRHLGPTHPHTRAYMPLIPKILKASFGSCGGRVYVAPFFKPKQSRVGCQCRRPSRPDHAAA